MDRSAGTERHGKRAGENHRWLGDPAADIPGRRGRALGQLGIGRFDRQIEVDALELLVDPPASAPIRKAVIRVNSARRDVDIALINFGPEESHLGFSL